MIHLGKAARLVESSFSFSCWGAACAGNELLRRLARSSNQVRCAPVRSNPQAETLPAREPALSSSDQQVTRLPPVEPAAVDHVLDNGTGIRLVSAYEQQPESPTPESLPAPAKVPRLLERLRIPNELPGANAPPLRIPLQERVPPAERDALIDELFPNRPLPARLASQVVGPTTLKRDRGSRGSANNPSKWSRQRRT